MTRIAEAHKAANKKLGKRVKGWKEFGELQIKCEQYEKTIERYRKALNDIARTLRSLAKKK